MLGKRMKGLWVLVALPLVCGAGLYQCGGLTADDFVLVSEEGLDAEDHAQDNNHYAWSMAGFTADEAKGSYLYVGTGNNIVLNIGLNGDSFTGEQPFNYAFTKPPQIMRYRPDQGETEWEKVFDIRDVEAGQPFFYTLGFRSMAVYRNASDGVNTIYAGTFGRNPSLWRSAAGEPGSWELFHQFDEEGSIRAMTVHDGLLYFAPTDEITGEPGPAKIFATDGETVWPVVEDGFGDPENGAIAAMESFNGYLYAGTANATGGELWRLEGPDKQEAPVLVIDDGGSDARNEVFGTMKAFKDAIYVGTLIFGGNNGYTGNGPKGADIVRALPDDSWETIVGWGGRSGYGPGFNKLFNGYLWAMEEHDGWLYAGTSDFTGLLIVAINQLDFSDPSTLVEQLRDLFTNFGLNSGQKQNIDPERAGNILGNGADLFKSEDGVFWQPVFRDGLGVDDSGVRTMESWQGSLYLGYGFPFSGAQVWKGTMPEETQ